MQTVEAVLSFLAFAAISSSLMMAVHPVPQDDSLYRLQLAEDVWRVLYLRGDLAPGSGEDGLALESDVRGIGDEAGLCVFIRGIETANCRGGPEREMTVSVSRTMFVNGSLRSVTLSLGR
jgi:hypothetical protein